MTELCHYDKRFQVSTYQSGLIPHNYGIIKKINNMYRSTLHSYYLESDSYLCNSLMVVFVLVTLCERW